MFLYDQYQFISKSPIYLTRGGDLNLGRGALIYAGSDSFAWPSTPEAQSMNAYNFRFDSDFVTASGNNTRWLGFTVQPSIPNRQAKITTFIA